MSTLQGRVAIITGASRGIGRAPALGLAKAGYHIVIVAKSMTESEKLPGSIFTVAAEMQSLRQAKAKGYNDLHNLLIEPDLDPIRQDKGFQDLLREYSASNAKP